MDENNFAPKEVGPTPGAAIGSFIVIAILVAGAVYILGGQLIKKNEPAPTSPTATSTATTTNSI